MGKSPLFGRCAILISSQKKSANRVSVAGARQHFYPEEIVRKTLLGLLLILGLALTGCSGAEPRPDNPRNYPSSGLNGVATGHEDGEGDFDDADADADDYYDDSEPEIPGAPDGMPDLWVKRIYRHITMAKNDFVRDALQDYAVSDEELKQSHERYLKCMEGHGLVGYVEGQWDYGLDEDSRTQYLDQFEDRLVGWEPLNEMQSECWNDGILPLVEVHRGLTVNPEALPWQAMTIRCLDAKGITEFNDVPHEELMDAIHAYDWKHWLYEPTRDCMETYLYLGSI